MINPTPPHVRFLLVIGVVRWSASIPTPSNAAGLVNFWVDALHFFHAERLRQTQSQWEMRWAVAEIQEQAGWFTGRFADTAIEQFIRKEVNSLLLSNTDSSDRAWSIRISIDRNPPPNPLFDSYRAWLESIRKSQLRPSKSRRHHKRIQLQTK